MSCRRPPRRGVGRAPVRAQQHHVVESFGSKPHVALHQVRHHRLARQRRLNTHTDGAAAGASAGSRSRQGETNGRPSSFRRLAAAASSSASASRDRRSRCRAAAAPPSRWRRAQRSGTPGSAPAPAPATSARRRSPARGLRGALTGRLSSMRSKAPAAVAGEQPVEQGCPRAPDVQVAGGRGAQRVTTVIGRAPLSMRPAERHKLTAASSTTPAPALRPGRLQAEWAQHSGGRAENTTLPLQSSRRRPAPVHSEACAPATDITGRGSPRTVSPQT